MPRAGMPDRFGLGNRNPWPAAGIARLLRPTAICQRVAERGIAVIETFYPDAVGQPCSPRQQQTSDQPAGTVVQEGRSAVARRFSVTVPKHDRQMNHWAHISKETKAWLATRPADRFAFVFMPTHASWLNLVKGFFSRRWRARCSVRLASHRRLNSRHDSRLSRWR
jgi:hypothetical protein